MRQRSRRARRAIEAIRRLPWPASANRALVLLQQLTAGVATPVAQKRNDAEHCRLLCAQIVYNVLDVKFLRALYANGCELEAAARLNVVSDVDGLSVQILRVQRL